ncbi:S-layer homology domain-containing protein [Collinsella sp. AF38-3AC]|uniref:S-layer homology domain-containing protein n=1 Tax=Collinsella sp. AF38-3AC TaxID=2292015 RepID=UPI0018F46574
MDATPHAGDIGWLAQAGISTGYPNGTFRPMVPVYRQDMATFLHRPCDHVVAHRPTESTNTNIFSEDWAVHIGPPDFFSLNCNYREHARWRRRRAKLPQVTMR